jgi:spore maturation protein CgeB
MNIGFMIKWPKGSLDKKNGNVIGDELLGESLSSAIKKIYPECKAELYAPNFLPKAKLDVMIYLNNIAPVNSYANSHVLYMQNGGLGEDVDNLLNRFVANNYDGYIFFSRKLLQIHKKFGGHGIFLPFGVDLNSFKPVEVDLKYEHEVAYIGNDIKGENVTMTYLYPALSFDFGLYGNWQLPKTRFWRNFGKLALYKRPFQKISKGKIPQSDVPTLYSSAKINLNCTLKDCVDWDVITLRTYEVLACRGFLISDIVPVAKELMNDCMVFTKGNDDLKEQIAYYLSNPKERERIANNGYEYVTKNASIEARAKELVDYIKEI